MTLPPLPDLREAFEAYFANSRRGRGVKKIPVFKRLPDDSYADEPTQRHWWTWQNAARAAIAAHVPEAGCGNIAAVPAQPVLDCDIQPRPLAYPLTDYHRAGIDGPLHYTWQDKPHRLLYDLIAAVRYYAAPQAVPTDKDSLMVAQAVPVPAGWALVPVEPTPEMLQAGVRDVLTRKTTTMADTYRAMLAAAPKEQPHE